MKCMYGTTTCVFLCVGTPLAAIERPGSKVVNGQEPGERTHIAARTIP